METKFKSKFALESLCSQFDFLLILQSVFLSLRKKKKKTKNKIQKNGLVTIILEKLLRHTEVKSWVLLNLHYSVLISVIRKWFPKHCCNPVTHAQKLKVLNILHAIIFRSLAVTFKTLTLFKYPLSLYTPAISGP